MGETSPAWLKRSVKVVISSWFFYFFFYFFLHSTIQLKHCWRELVLQYNSRRRIKIINKLLHPAIELENVRIMLSHLSGRYLLHFPGSYFSSSKNLLYTYHSKALLQFYFCFLPCYLQTFLNLILKPWLCWIVLSFSSALRKQVEGTEASLHKALQVITRRICLLTSSIQLPF